MEATFASSLQKTTLKIDTLKLYEYDLINKNVSMHILSIQITGSNFQNEKMRYTVPIIL